MNLNMKNLFGQANKGIGKLKGFLFGSSQSEETSSSSSQDEPNNKSNPNLIQQKNIDSKSPKKDDSKNNTIIKSSKGQFDFSEEDDEEDSKTKKSQQESEDIKNFEYTEPEEDYWKIAHRLYLKNSMVDIEPLPYVPFIKVKKNDNLLSLIGFGKKNQIKEIKYFAVFDEHFLYIW